MKIGNVELENNIFLAPMAGITDLPFRLICKENDAGLVYTEMVSAKALLYNDEKTKLLLKTCDKEKPLAVQIFGSDVEAIAYARKMFIRREENRTGASDIIERLSDIEVLNKAGLTFKGQITRTALMLLGKKESSFYFDGFVPRITWTLYNADKSVKAYEHFDMPLLLAVDKVYGKIRNEKYRYCNKYCT